MKFVLVDDQVVSVELSVNALYRIANALDTHIDTCNISRDGEGLTQHDKALAEGFKNAYREFNNDEPVAEESETTE
jgi:hypothetical protein